VDAASLLREISATGPYFEVTTTLDGAGWRPLGELFDSDVMRARVAEIQRTLAERTGNRPDEIDRRASASTHFLAVASRLLSPALAGLATLGVGLDPDPEHVWWQPVEGGPIPFAWTAAAAVAADSPGHAADLLARGVLTRIVRPFAAACASTFRLSEQVLHGNTASALNGAAIMLRRGGRPLVIEPTAIVAKLIDGGALSGAADYTATGFVRRNCCLFYRVPGGGLCGDCVLVAH